MLNKENQACSNKEEKHQRSSYFDPTRFRSARRYSSRAGLVGETGRCWPWRTRKSGFDVLSLIGKSSGTASVIWLRSAITLGPIPISRKSAVCGNKAARLR